MDLETRTLLGRLRDRLEDRAESASEEARETSASGTGEATLERFACGQLSAYNTAISIIDGMLRALPTSSEEGRHDQ